MPARLIVERRGPLLLLTLSHPEKRNALTPSLLGELIEVLSAERAAKEPPRAVVVAGEAGPAFSAGFDLDTLPPLSPAAPLPDDLVARAMAALEEAPFPSVAAMHGAA